MMKEFKLYLIEHISSTLSSLSFPIVEFTLNKPKNKSFGDLSSNLPLLIGSRERKEPLKIAKIISKSLREKNLKNVIDINVTPPGFLNFRISSTFFQQKVDFILRKNENFGKGSIGVGKSANVEFVSANPTGPLTVGHGRNAIIGDIIARILEWKGYKVTREYYFNDAGRQMRILGNSVEARYYEILGKSFDFPKDGYRGDYIINIAKKILKRYGRNINRGDSVFQRKAEKMIFNEIKDSLKNLGVQFDVFTNEKSFYENEKIDNLLGALTKKNSYTKRMAPLGLIHPL